MTAATQIASQLMIDRLVAAEVARIKTADLRNALDELVRATYGTRVEMEAARELAIRALQDSSNGA